MDVARSSLLKIPFLSLTEFVNHAYAKQANGLLALGSRYSHTSPCELVI